MVRDTQNPVTKLQRTTIDLQFRVVPSVAFKSFGAILHPQVQPLNSTVIINKQFTDDWK